MMKKSVFLAFILALCLLPTAFAKEGQMKLLAISQEDGEIKGNTADLHLKITRGNGNVYMDTFPLTKLDTQISIRFAKEIACDYLDDMDCSRYDFHYRIRSDSVIIGGPSAGSALTMLTISTLKGWDAGEETTITGTINPGGFIGSVGGISEKIKAAGDSGIEKVLIPKGSVNMNSTNGSEVWGNYVNNTNATDVQEIAKQEGVELVEVTSLDEVVYEFTGKRRERKNIEINAEQSYLNYMKNISRGLCGRTNELFEKVNDTNNSRYQEALNLSERAEPAFAGGAYYTSASFCFGANIQLSYLNYRQKNLTKEEIRSEMERIRENIRELDNEVTGENKNTINELQTFMVVKERLIEAEDYLKTTSENLEKNNTQNAVYNLAYGLERTKSALYWSKFMERPGKVFDINRESLKRSCIRKLSEAEERNQYAKLYLPSSLKDTREELDKAYEDKRNGRYALCLYKASKAKAEADLLLGSIGLTRETAGDYMDIKLQMIEETIKRQQEKDIFPILGYSYYEYGKSLRESDTYSALLYSQYAIELSKLDIYFQGVEKEQEHRVYIDYTATLYFLVGAIFGVLLTFAFYPLLFKPGKKKDQVTIKVGER